MQQRSSSQAISTLTNHTPTRVFKLALSWIQSRNEDGLTLASCTSYFKQSVEPNAKVYKFRHSVGLLRDVQHNDFCCKTEQLNSTKISAPEFEEYLLHKHAHSYKSLCGWWPTNKRVLAFVCLLLFCVFCGMWIQKPIHGQRSTCSSEWLLYVLMLCCFFTKHVNCSVLFLANLHFALTISATVSSNGLSFTQRCKKSQQLVTRSDAETPIARSLLRLADVNLRTHVGGNIVPSRTHADKTDNIPDLSKSCEHSLDLHAKRLLRLSLRMIYHLLYGHNIKLVTAILQF